MSGAHSDTAMVLVLSVQRAAHLIDCERRNSVRVEIKPPWHGKSFVVEPGVKVEMLAIDKIRPSVPRHSIPGAVGTNIPNGYTPLVVADSANGEVVLTDADSHCRFYELVDLRWDGPCPIQRRRR